MAKVQSFADKLKKKQKEEAGIAVKVIKAYKTDKGSTGFIERLIKVKEISELDNIDENSIVK